MVDRNNLKPHYQRFILGVYETEYHAKDNIVLEIDSNGRACITIGCFAPLDPKTCSGLNPHGLQKRDLHKGTYKTPYFAYKNYYWYNSKDEALDAFDKWLEHRESNIKDGAEALKKSFDASREREKNAKEKN